MMMPDSKDVSSLAKFFVSSRLDIAMTCRELRHWEYVSGSLSGAAHESSLGDIWPSGYVCTWNFYCNGR